MTVKDIFPFVLILLCTACIVWQHQISISKKKNISQINQPPVWLEKQKSIIAPESNRHPVKNLTSSNPMHTTPPPEIRRSKGKHQGKTPPPTTPHSHLLILMGRGTQLKPWMRLISDSPNLTHVDLVLGIFDGSVTTLACRRGVLCVSVAGTTWTTGRNKLIRAALDSERKQNKTYSFWTLADADLALHCPNLADPGGCLKQYDNFLAQLPENATAATLIANGSWAFMPNTAMVNLHGMDAAWNSFRRNTIPILFPYKADLDAVTWWSSQAIFWYRMQCLAPLYVVTPLFIFYNNTEHGDYPRNPRNYTEEHRFGTKNMGRLSRVVQRAPSHYSLEFKKEKVRSLPLELNQSMDSVFYSCSKEFTGGFYSWAGEKSALQVCTKSSIT